MHPPPFRPPFLRRPRCPSASSPRPALVPAPLAISRRPLEHDGHAYAPSAEAGHTYKPRSPRPAARRSGCSRPGRYVNSNVAICREVYVTLLSSVRSEAFPSPVVPRSRGAESALSSAKSGTPDALLFTVAGVSVIASRRNQSSERARSPLLLLARAEARERSAGPRRECWIRREAGARRAVGRVLLFDASGSQPGLTQVGVGCDQHRKDFCSRLLSGPAAPLRGACGAGGTA